MRTALSLISATRWPKWLVKQATCTGRAVDRVPSIDATLTVPPHVSGTAVHDRDPPIREIFTKKFQKTKAI